VSAEDLDAQVLLRIGPQEVLAIAAEHGVPRDASPVVALLDVQPGLASGWLFTLRGRQHEELEPPEPWPPGKLTIVGAMPQEGRDEHQRPILGLGDSGVVAYAAELTIPSGRATAEAVWRPLPAGLHTAIRTHPRSTAIDDKLASAAKRWLANLRRGGRPQRSYAEAFEEALGWALTWHGKKPSRDPSQLSYAALASGAGHRDVKAVENYLHYRQIKLDQLREALRERLRAS
jgi:hypothetical protein